MLSHHKVVWSEGMFLRPQHFQQQERHLRRALHLRTRAIGGPFWGFVSLAIDHDALATGRVVLLGATGVFPDGTPFAFDEAADAPGALAVPAEARDVRVVLAIPRERAGAAEVDFTGEAEPLARHGVIEAEVEDTTPGGLEPALMQLGRLRLRLALEGTLGDDWLTLGVARVRERRADNRVVLDERYIPPTLAAGDEPRLAGFIDELSGLLEARADALAGRLGQPGRGGVSEVADFMLLEVVNRYRGALWHASQLSAQSPERLFHDWLMLACTLATYTAPGRRPGVLPEYRHDDLAASFDPLMDELRRSLSAVLEQSAIAIPLHDRGQNVRVAQIADPALLREAGFVLAVRADLAGDLLRATFPTQAKIGPVERIRDLVHLQLPGVTVRALPVVPRQIPYRAGHMYFELDKAGDFWREVERSGALALHVAGDFPGLAMEFWAIRD